MPVGVFHVPFFYDAFSNVYAFFGRFEPLTLNPHCFGVLLDHRKSFWP